MRKIILLLVFITAILSVPQAQSILEEDFEGAGLPADWTQTTNATDGGWKFGTPAALSSQFWSIPANGSTQIAATNDDACNCDKSHDYLITPLLDFSTLSGVALSFDMFFGKGVLSQKIQKHTRSKSNGRWISRVG